MDDFYKIDVKSLNNLQYHVQIGELIDVEVPVLFDFFTEWDEAQTPCTMLRDVAAALGDKAKGHQNRC